jgi:hypothetical protein
MNVPDLTHGRWGRAPCRARTGILLVEGQASCPVPLTELLLRAPPGTRTLTTRALNAVPLPVGLGRHIPGADNGPRTRDLHHGEVALFLLSYIRVEPSAGLAPAPSSLPRKPPDSGTARA